MYKVEFLTESEFKEKVFNYDIHQEWKYEGDKPCIIDFYADWCNPCKMLSPVLDELMEEYQGAIQIYKINTEQERELSAKFGIQSIPSMLFVPMNEQPQMSVGLLPKDSLKKAIKDVLKVDEPQAKI